MQRTMARFRLIGTRISEAFDMAGTAWFGVLRVSDALAGSSRSRVIRPLSRCGPPAFRHSGTADLQCSLGMGPFWSLADLLGYGSLDMECSGWPLFRANRYSVSMTLHEHVAACRYIYRVQRVLGPGGHESITLAVLISRNH